MTVYDRETTDGARDYWISATHARRRGQRRLMRAYVLHARTLEAAASIRPRDDWHRLAAATAAAMREAS